MKHTKEPWHVMPDDRNDHPFIHSDGYTIARVQGRGPEHDEANAARIASCVNALAGVENPEKAMELAGRLLRLGYELSCYAASIKWDPKFQNTKEWLVGLKAIIEQYQKLYGEGVLAAHPEKKRGMKMGAGAFTALGETGGE